MTAYGSIVIQLARESVSRAARRAIRRLQMDTESRASGPNSGLGNVWDEICVQVQFQESVFWSAYEALVRDLVAREVEAMPRLELSAIWLETQQGSDWECEHGDSSSAIPVFGDDVTDYIVRHVMSTAADWSNPRIRAYLAKSDLD